VTTSKDNAPPSLPTDIEGLRALMEQVSLVAWEIQSILGALREVRERSEVVKSIRVELLPEG